MITGVMRVTPIKVEMPTWNGGGVCSTNGGIPFTKDRYRNLRIGHNQSGKKQIKWNKLSMIKDHVTLRRTFGKYQIVISTREEWDKN